MNAEEISKRLGKSKRTIEREIKRGKESLNIETKLQEMIEIYKNRTGYYSIKILADKIYRNRDNLA